MEDHRRELAYFEKDDLNLPPELEIKDIMMVMTRCKDVTIRFQVTHSLDGPVKMIFQDGIIFISSNLDWYYPEVSTKTTKLYMKPNSFNPEKLMRAEVAEKLYKVDQILAPTARVDAHENIVMDNRLVVSVLYYETNQSIFLRSSQDGGRIRK